MLICGTEYTVQLKERWTWGPQELGSDLRHDSSWLHDHEQLIDTYQALVFSSVP